MGANNVSNKVNWEKTRESLWSKCGALRDTMRCIVVKIKDFVAHADDLWVEHEMITF